MSVDAAATTTMGWMLTLALGHGCLADLVWKHGQEQVAGKQHNNRDRAFTVPVVV